MKKLIIAFVAVGAVMALRPVLKRRMAQKMRAHCRQMMTGQVDARGDAGQMMRERCEQGGAQAGGRGEAVGVNAVV